ADAQAVGEENRGDPGAGARKTIRPGGVHRWGKTHFGSLEHSAPGGGNQGLPALRAFERASRRADRVWVLFAEAATRRPVTGGRAFAHSGKFASKSWPP